MIQPIRLNLVDWRLAQQKRHLRHALLILIGVVLIALILPMALSQWLEHRLLVPRQHHIQRLLEENDKLATRLQKTRQLQHRIQQHRRQLLIVNALQKTRPALHRHLDQLAEATPRSIQLSRLTAQQGLVTLEGTTSASHHVATYVKRLAQFRDFEQVQLAETAKEQQDGTSRTRFSLSLQIRGRHTADHKPGADS